MPSWRKTIHRSIHPSPDTLNVSIRFPAQGGTCDAALINEIFYKTFGHQNRKPRRTLIAN
jgi:hypothetical protein